MDQLTAQTIGSTTTTFAYDGDGRRTSLDEGSTHLVYTYDDASQLSSIDNGTTYTYDDAGRRLGVTTSGSSETYDYDPAGRLATLTSIQGSSTTTQTRTYDPFDTLIGLSDQTGATTTSNIYDWNQDAGNPQPTGSTVDQATTDLLGLDSTDVTQTSGIAAATSQDNFGPITATPTAANLNACATGYDAWGNPTTTPAPTTIPCLGYRNQLSTNTLYYAHPRNYDPTTGTFTTTDPATMNPNNPAASNWYAYANNNPITNTDPTGLYAVTDNAADPISIRSPHLEASAAIPKCASDFAQLDNQSNPCAIGPTYGPSSALFPCLGHQPLALAWGLLLRVCNRVGHFQWVAAVRRSW